MAQKIIDRLMIINPKTNRTVKTLKTVTNLVRNNIIPVPEGLIFTDSGKLIVSNEKNITKLKTKGFVEYNGNITNFKRINFNKDEYNKSEISYVKQVIKESGLKGLITINYYNSNKEQLITTTYEVSNDNSWYKNEQARPWLTDDSSLLIFDTIDTDGSYFIIVKLTESIPESIAQNFKRGISNCLLTPIKNYFENLHKNAKSQSRKNVYKTSINKIDKFLEIYQNTGVPETDINKITDALSITIVITDLLNNTIIHKSPATKSIKRFEYINRDIDHVDEIKEDNVIDVSYDDFKKLTLNNGDIILGKTKKIINGDIYRILRIEEEKVKEWEKSQNYDTMEYFQDPEVSDFVRKGCHHSGSVDYVENPFKNIESLEHIDHVKSYYSFKKCNLYDKFKLPNKPQIYSKVPKDFDYTQYAGIWQIENVNLNKVNKEHLKHLSKLNIYNKSDNYTTPELYFMNSLGITFDLVAGAYSHLNRDINMEPLLSITCPEHDKCPNTCQFIKPYKVWIGKQSSIKLDKVIKIKGTKQLASLLAVKYGKDRVLYNEIDNIINIYVRNSYIKHRSHLVAYLLSYSRIQILQQLLKIPFNKVRRVNVDDIYYEKCTLDIEDNFQNKAIVYKSNVAGNIYFSSYKENVWNPPEYNELIKHRIIYATGRGGTGKTHFYLTYRGFPNITYVAKENRIVEEKRKEYDLKYACTYHKLMGLGTVSYTGETNVLLLDECSKYTQEDINNLMIKYNKSVIIYSGDPYQLKSFEEGKREANYDKYYKMSFNKNFRCKDKKLNEILETLIEMYDDNKTTSEMLQYVKPLLNKGTLDQYTVNDYIICSNHKKIDEYTELLKDKPKKWLIVKQNSHNYVGTVHILEEQPIGSELKHAFTAHATQGITIKKPIKMFIDTERLFYREMLYTVLSRVEYLDQIYLL